jgi:hypothetical protein
MIFIGRPRESLYLQTYILDNFNNLIVLNILLNYFLDFMRAYLNFLTSSISNIINRLSLPYFTISIPIFLSYFSYTYSYY